MCEPHKHDQSNGSWLVFSYLPPAAAKGLALYTPVLRRLCLQYLCIIKGNKRVDVGVLMCIRKSG
jgi:hypothetical protein